MDPYGRRKGQRWRLAQAPGSETSFTGFDFTLGDQTSFKDWVILDSTSVHAYYWAYNSWWTSPGATHIMILLCDKAH